VSDAQLVTGVEDARIVPIERKRDRADFDASVEYVALDDDASPTTLF
jgi:hypothetical protein